MSFIFSRALVAEFSPANYSDTDASVPSNTNPTPRPCLWHDKTTEHSRLSRFGMTCAPLTDDRGAELLMSFAAAFRARTSAQPEAGGVSTASARDSGEKWPESSVKYDLDSHSWKTAHCLWEEVLPWSSVTLPKWGMTRNGSVCRHPTSERPISATGYGLWQTIVADDSADRKSGKWNSRGEPKLSAQVMNPQYWPTPTRDSATERTKRYAQGGTPLTMAVHRWPTPTVCGNYNRKGASAKSGDGLATVVTQRTWPTATAYKGWSPNHNRASSDDRLDYSVERESFQPGQQTPPMRLNPEWVEWLMGWPIGHTGLKPLETGRYQEWLQQHLPRCVMNDRAA